MSELLEVQQLKAGMTGRVPFALGEAIVRLLGEPYLYCAGPIWHVEDVNTGHQDFVGEEWITPATDCWVEITNEDDGIQTD